MCKFEHELRADLAALRARKEAAQATAYRQLEQLRRERAAQNQAVLQRNQQVRANAQM